MGSPHAHVFRTHQERYEVCRAHGRSPEVGIASAYTDGAHHYFRLTCGHVTARRKSYRKWRTAKVVCDQCAEKRERSL